MEYSCVRTVPAWQVGPEQTCKKSRSSLEALPNSLCTRVSAHRIMPLQLWERERERDVATAADWAGFARKLGASSVRAKTAGNTSTDSEQNWWQNHNTTRHSGRRIRMQIMVVHGWVQMLKIFSCLLWLAGFTYLVLLQRTNVPVSPNLLRIYEPDRVNTSKKIRFVKNSKPNASVFACWIDSPNSVTVLTPSLVSQHNRIIFSALWILQIVFLALH